METKVSALLAEVPDLPGHEVQRLLEAATGLTRAGTLRDPVVDATQVARFRDVVARRRRGEPLQYIEGLAHFGPLVLGIDRRALIPRPETERLWELAIESITEVENPIVVDLCTGSGNLALAIKHAIPTASVIGVDISAPALTLAKENAARAGLDVEFIEGDLFGALAPRLRGKVDLVVSNPPYIASGEMEGLPDEVRRYEPHAALEAGVTGTEVLGRIAAAVEEWLRAGGVVACEIGESQSDECLRMFAHLDPRIESDLADRPRFVLGSAPQRRDVH